MRTPYRMVDTLAEAVSFIDGSLPLFVDTEGLGLYKKTRLLQLYQAEWDAVIMVPWVEEFEVLTLLNNYHQVYHNAHYDLTTFQEQSKMFAYVPPNYDCTLLLSRLAIPDKEEYSLDAVMSYVLGYDPYDRQGLNKKALQKSNWKRDNLSDDQLAYAATDVYYMPQVWEAVCGAREDTSYKLDKHTLTYCLKFQWEGMPVDMKRLNSKLSSLNKEIKEANAPINVNSYQQVRSFLDTTESDDLALARMEISGNDKAKLVRAVRKKRKQVSFLEKFARLMVSDRILGKFKPSARSGRLTSNDQNLQQLPRSLKEVFGVHPGEGRILLYADYPQLELRTICAIVHCTLMEQIFRDGTDLHTYTAEFIFGTMEAILAECDGDEEKAKKIWKRNRQIAKTCNFSLLYGGGINMFISILISAAGILIGEGEANRIRQKWRKLWKEIFGWQERGIKRWRAGQLGSTPLGRKYKAKRMTDYLNIENQGAGAECAKLALHYFMQDYHCNYPEDWDVKVCNFIHDSYILEVPDDPEVYKQIAEDLARCMQLAWFELSKCMKVKDLPMPINVAAGYNWGDIESDDVPNVFDYELEPYAMLKEVA